MKTTETKLNGIDVPKNKDEFVLLKDLKPGDAFKAYDLTYVVIKYLDYTLTTCQTGTNRVLCLNDMTIHGHTPDSKVKVCDLLDYLEINTVRPPKIDYHRYPYFTPVANPTPWYDAFIGLKPKPPEYPDGTIIYCNSQNTNTADLDMQDHIGLRR